MFLFLACFTGFTVSVVFCLVSTYLVRNMAVRHGWVSQPTSRDVHSAPIPRLGGIPIFASTIAGSAAFYLVARALHVVPWGENAILLLLGPATVIFLVGLIDDLWGISPWMKLAGQVAAASLLFLSGLNVSSVPLLFGHHVFSYMVAVPLTIAWVVWITNAFNLIDGLDGLSAGSALFSTVAMVIISAFHQNFAAAALGAIMAGAIIGFLKYNFNPATIFLGDCGSLLIGFTLGAMAIAGGHQKTPTMVAVAIPVICFGLPVMETAISILRRFLSGRPIFTADREHLHHKLMERGLSHRQVVVVLYGVSILFACVSLIMLYPRRGIILVAVTAVCLLIWAMLYYLGYHEFVELQRVAARAMEQRKVIVNNLAIRRAEQKLRQTGSWLELKEALDLAFCNGDFDAYQLELQEGLSGSKALWQHCGWNREPKAAMGPIWRLTLELRDMENKSWGVLQVSRQQCDDAVLVDINVLSAEFLNSLTSAVSRLSLRPETVVATASTERTDALQAAAGKA